MSEECLKKCLNDSEMSKAEDKVVEFFNHAESVQVEEGAWYYHESSVESELKSLHEQLAKANERVKELEQNQLPIENGENRYGLDVSYFRNVINRELNRPLDNYKPDELARVLARLSRTADKSVMFEPEFSNKFAIEKKCEGIDDFMSHFRYEYEGARDTDSIESFADKFTEQLRKEQEK